MKSKRKLNGYTIIYMPEHPNSMKSKNWEGYIYEHIIIAEKCIGRYIKEDEVVHHLDLNRSNNHPTNLLVLLKSQHAKLHNFIKYGSKDTRCTVCNSYTTNKRFCSVECRNAYELKVSKFPGEEELLNDMIYLSYVQIGEKYGVSEATVRQKWTNKLNLENPFSIAN